MEQQLTIDFEQQRHAKSTFKLDVGTLFSGIGAFEHALDQLKIKHDIQFACDCGERELPLTYYDLTTLLEGLDYEQIHDYCSRYINSIGVKVEFRAIETELLFEIGCACSGAQLVNVRNTHKREEHPFSSEICVHHLRMLKAPIVLTYEKDDRKSKVKHTLILTQEQIVKLTPGLDIKQRELYVNGRYMSMKKQNRVKEAYFANYKIREDQWHEDIRFLDATAYLGKLDILVGGSPCQSFSNYGKKLGLEDVRGTLFYDYARVIKEAQPKVFIYENVQNLLNHDKGKTWKVMLEVWQSLGYELKYSILDAKDYNHPQLRTRLFLIGFRKDIYKMPYQFPGKKELTRKSTEYLETGIIDNKYYLGQKGFEWITTPTKNRRRSRVNQDIIGCQTANQQDNWIGDFRVEHARPRHYNDPKIHIGKFDFKDGKGLVDAVGRKMTPRECMNLMGFDNTFKIVVDDSTAYRQAGNSIVVPVLKEIIQSIIPYLK